MSDLADKLNQLRQRREQAIANVHALNGAIELAEQLLAEQQEPQEARPKPEEDDD